MGIYVFLASIFAAIGTIYAVYRTGKKHGETETKEEGAEVIIDDIATAKMARDALNHRKSMRDKLRAKYTRK